MINGYHNNPQFWSNFLNYILQKTEVRYCRYQITIINKVMEVVKHKMGLRDLTNFAQAVFLGSKPFERSECY